MITVSIISKTDGTKETNNIYSSLRDKQSLRFTNITALLTGNTQDIISLKSNY